jgi:hypothetical protein
MTHNARAVTWKTNRADDYYDTRVFKLAVPAPRGSFSFAPIAPSLHPLPRGCVRAMDPPREGAQQQSEEELLQAAISLSLAEEAARAEAAGGASGGADAGSDGSAGSLKRSLSPGTAAGAQGSDANSRRQRTAVRPSPKP